MKRLVAALASVALLLMTASAAMAAGAGDGSPIKPPIGGPRSSSVPTDVGSVLDRILTSFVPPLMEPGVVPAAAVAGGTDPFAALRGDAYASYGTGTAYTSDAELSGVKVAVEKAFSAATYGSVPLPDRLDEVERKVAPALAAGRGFGWGSSAEIGRGEDRQELGDDSEATAPPSAVVDEEVADINLVPILRADLLRSRASARSASNGCVIGSDLAFGQGQAIRSDIPGEKNDAERPILSLSEEDPPRAVSQSASRTGLVPPAAPNSARFGLFSETRQTIAPVTLFKGTPQELTIEVAGEWILRVATDGTRGTVAYGPEVEDSDTPVVRIDRKQGRDTILTAQDIAQADGTDLSTPGVDEFVIGEAPRAIGGGRLSKPIVTGTRVSAAVDVLRVRIPDETEPDGVIEVRVGHMEAAVAVPAGGISCPGIAMAKTSQPAEVAPGEIFEWTIKLSNPNDCTLDQVKVTDVISTTPGLRYRILDAAPRATASGSTLVFSGFRPLGLGESFVARIRVEAEPGARPGRFTNEARATGTCGAAPLSGESRTGTAVNAAPVPRDGSVVLEAPEVRGATAAAAGPTPIPGRTPLAAVESENVGVELDGQSVVRARSGATPRSGQQPGTGGSASRSGALARSGGWYGFLSGLSLLAGGRVLRLLKRRR